MSDTRQKTRQFNFRLPPDLAGEFEVYCEIHGISFTSFIDSAIRKALGKPVPLPGKILGESSQSQPADSTVADSQNEIQEIKQRLANLEAEMGKSAA